MAGLSTQNQFGLQEATGSSSRAAAVPSTHNLFEGAKTVTVFLLVSTTLTKLNLSQGGVGQVDTTLTEALSVNTKLHKVYLSRPLYTGTEGTATVDRGTVCQHHAPSAEPYSNRYKLSCTRHFCTLRSPVQEPGAAQAHS